MWLMKFAQPNIEWGRALQGPRVSVELQQHDGKRLMCSMAREGAEAEVQYKSGAAMASGLSQAIACSGYIDAGKPQAEVYTYILRLGGLLAAEICCNPWETHHAFDRFVDWVICVADDAR